MIQAVIITSDECLLEELEEAWAEAEMRCGIGDETSDDSYDAFLLEALRLYAYHRQDELTSEGLAAELIRHGYDPKTFAEELVEIADDFDDDDIV